MEDMRPGNVISPGSASGQNAQSQVPPAPVDLASPIAAQPQNTYVPSVQAVSTQDMIPEVQSPSPTQQSATIPAPQAYQQTAQAVSPTFTQAQQPMARNEPTSTAPSLSWSAAEYLHHDKNAAWYGITSVGTAVLSAIVYFATKDIFSAGIVFVAILGLLLFVSRKPQVQDYTVDGPMIRVGQKTYDLDNFKAFSAQDDGRVIEVTLLPLRRLMPLVVIHADPQQVDELIDHLADYLPMEQREPDVLDGLLRRMRL